MRTNDDFNNKKLMDEIDELENNNVIDGNCEAINNKNGISIKNIIITVIIVAILAFLYTCYTSYDGDVKSMLYDYEDYEEFDYESYQEEIEDVEENFTTQKENFIFSRIGRNANGNLLLSLENKNKEDFKDVDVYAVFFDGEDKIIGIDRYSVTYVKGESKIYFSLYDVPDTFEKCDFFVEKKYFDVDEYTEIFNDKIEFFAESIDEYIEISFRNNSDEDIDLVSFSIIYYDKDNNILDIEETYEFDIEQNKTKTIYGGGCKYFNEDTWEKLEYDHYEVVLNSAIHYNY